MSDDVIIRYENSFDLIIKILRQLSKLNVNVTKGLKIGRAKES